MFQLCKDGWALYDVWVQLLEATKPKAPKKDIRTAKNIYYQHRQECGTCTKPPDKLNPTKET